MSVRITGVTLGSPAHKAKILAGDNIVSINGHIIEDVLDYRFYMIEKNLKVEIEREGKKEILNVKKKDEYDDLGLEFDTYLMDKQRHCKNKCIFCFIDQLPSGMRDSLYFKDDDSRLSFLFGNYITLTNLTAHEVDRIIEMHISPVNISVHTTNPELRCKMMKNPNAGKALEYLYKFAEAGIKINCQLVLVPGYNDGQELVNSMEDLSKLYPAVQSVAAVPVGLTDHREGLEKLEAFNKESSLAVIDAMESAGNRMMEQYNDRLFYPSDEFYLKAEKPVPEIEFYGDLLQLENGVGMYALFKSQYKEGLDYVEGVPVKGKQYIATGKAAYGLIKDLVDITKEKYPELDCQVEAVENNYFGKNITVSGLLTATDIIKHFKNIKADRIILPSSALDNANEKFLDDLTPEDVRKELNTEIVFSDGTGDGLLNILFE